MKRIISVIALSLAVLLSITGCATKTVENTDTGTAAETVTTSVETEANETSSPESETTEPAYLHDDEGHWKKSADGQTEALDVHWYGVEAVVSPTKESDGKISLLCDVCGYRSEVPVPYVGHEIYTFGKGEDENGEETDLSWVVLARKDGKILLLCEEVFGLCPYSESGDSAWKNSDAREYLNGGFINETFSESEKARIVETTFTAENDELSTTDKVFLLSDDEMEKYHLDTFEGIIAALGEENYRVNWWLRTMESDEEYISCVVGNYMYGPIYVSYADANMFLRPALWVEE